MFVPGAVWGSPNKCIWISDCMDMDTTAYFGPGVFASGFETQ